MNLKRNHLYIVFTFMLVFVHAQAQKTTINGYLYDFSSNETIIGGALFSVNSKVGTHSNEYGYYSLTLGIDDTLIKVRAYGFKDTLIKLKTHKSTITKNIYLSASVKTYDQVNVYGKKSIIHEDEMGVTSIPMKDIRRMPNLFGEVDIIKTYQLTPGVESGGEGSSNYYVRGGGSEQNLMLLDDVPLYNVSHFGGFFSVFNADIIKNTKLTKSGFSAEYGGRLSSVLDVRMKEGSSKSYNFQGSVGLLSSRFSAEGPIIKDKVSFILSGRINPLPIFKILGTELDYRFNDLNAKIHINASDKNKFYFSFYRGRDKVGIRTGDTDLSSIEDDLSWGNTMLAFRWNHKFGAKMFSNMTVYSTQYSYIEARYYSEKTDTSSRETTNELATGVHDYGIKYDVSYFFNSRLKMKFGLSSVFHRFTPNDLFYEQVGTNIQDFSRQNDTELVALENGVYLEFNYAYKWFSVTAGARYTDYFVDDTYYSNIEPRALASIRIDDNWSIKYAYSVMNQYIHLLAYSGTGLPSDYWMPTNSEIPPSRGIQHSIGVFRSIKQDTYVASLEGYFKETSGMINFKPGETLIGQTDEWHETVEKNGDNQAYGVELMIEKKRGDLKGWFSASYSRSLLQFDNLNNGDVFPFKYDRPLSINFVALYDLNKHISLSLTWQYGTGYPITLANEIYTYNEDIVFNFEGVNNVRMRDYHRMDAAFNHSKKTKWGERTWTVSVFNLYNRRNPYYYYYRYEIINVIDENGNIEPKKGDLKLLQRSLFTFLPSFSYSFKF